MNKCKCGHSREEHTKDMGICQHTDPKETRPGLSKEEAEKNFGYVPCMCHTFETA